LYGNGTNGGRYSLFSFNSANSAATSNVRADIAARLVDRRLDQASLEGICAIGEVVGDPPIGE